MPRRGRIVIPNIPHHVTQRGGRRQDVFFSDGDREVYLNLLAESAARHGARFLTYALMTNHVHHLVVPLEKDSLQWTFQTSHKRYAEYINARGGWTGHLWQARFYSSPVDDRFFWTAVRYILQNPVKAHRVRQATDYPWSSARAHCAGSADRLISTEGPYAERLRSRTDWESWLAISENPEDVAHLRKCTFRDLPTGSTEFLDSLEREYGVIAHPPKMGRPKVVKS